MSDIRPARWKRFERADRMRVRTWRLAEFEEVVRPLLPRTGKVLEVGCGDGALAERMVAHGLSVVCTDVSTHEDCRLPVIEANAEQLPFEDGAFDLVFTSNVLEHIEDVDAALTEMGRVLADGGKMIHILPTGACTLLSLASHWLVWPRVTWLRRGIQDPIGATSEAAVGAKFWRRRIWNMLGLAPHGQSASRWHELFCWGERSWRRRFEAAGLEVVEVYPGPAAYSMYGLFGVRGERIRRGLARFGMAAVRVYVVHRASR